MVVSPSKTMLVFQGIRELAETHLKLSTMLGIIEEMCDEIIDEDAEIVVRRKFANKSCPQNCSINCEG